MIGVKIKVDTRGSINHLRKLAKQVPFAASRALNATAKHVLNAQVAEMKRVFDAPTRYVLGALKVVNSTKANLTAYVQTKTPTGRADADNVLTPQIEGGKRTVKAFEAALQARGLMPKGFKAVPGRGAKRDAFGNISKATINTILRTVALEGPKAPPKLTKSGKKRKVKADAQLFAVIDKRGRMNPGIYKREGRKPVNVISYISSVTYKRLFNFYSVGQKEAQERFDIEFDKALAAAMADSK